MVDVPIINGKPFDFKNPDYTAIFSQRAERLKRLRDRPESFSVLLTHYKNNPAQMIIDWGLTADPRNAERNLPVIVPFILFPRQIEWIDWAVNKWKNQTSAPTVKSRDMGLSWLTVALACVLSITHDDLVIGFGSRKEEYVDKIGSPKSLFFKARMFMQLLPPELRGGYQQGVTDPHMRIRFPNTGSVLVGEAGDGIGRGDRASIYFVDEAQPLWSSVMTPRGWVKMGDLKIGDTISHPSGSTSTIKAIGSRFVKPVYEFTFSDGTIAHSSPNHLWTVDKVWGKKERKTIRAKEIADKFLYKSQLGQTQFIYRLPACEKVVFDNQKNLPIAPYLLGALLGDGCMCKASVEITSVDLEVLNRIEKLLPDGFSLSHAGRITYRISHKEGRGRSRSTKQAYLNHHLENLGLRGCRSWEKFIPEIYKLSSVENRIELLRGLMDTDGSASGGRVTFHSSSQKLSDGVAFIVRSLGGIARQKIKPDHRGYRDQHYVYISMPPEINPFHLSRKSDKVRSKASSKFHKTIVDVRLVTEDEVQCIEVSSHDGLYITDGFSVTHNCAFLERPQLVEASLSQTTNCRLDVSTPNGLANPFAEKVRSGKFDTFTFHWRDDPRKDDEWYEKQKESLDPVTIAQEIDIDFAASIDGVLIPSAWVQSAIDADKKLNIDGSGAKLAALDVADLGKDSNALSLRNGIIIEDAREWHGKSVEDIFGTTEKAIGLCDEWGVTVMRYDSDGLGAGVRGDSRVINEERKQGGLDQIKLVAFHGGGSVFKPDDEYVKGRTNDSFFDNLKAQSWWLLRDRFKATHDAVTEGKPYNVDDLIVIRGDMPQLAKLISELSQPTYKRSTRGKIQINKAPDGTKSPNIADSIMIAFANIKTTSGYSWDVFR